MKICRTILYYILKNILLIDVELPFEHDSIYGTRKFKKDLPLLIFAKKRFFRLEGGPTEHKIGNAVGTCYAIYTLTVHNDVKK